MPPAAPTPPATDPPTGRPDSGEGTGGQPAEVPISRNTERMAREALQLATDMKTAFRELHEAERARGEDPGRPAPVAIPEGCDDLTTPDGIINMFTKRITEPPVIPSVSPWDDMCDVGGGFPF